MSKPCLVALVDAGALDDSAMRQVRPEGVEPIAVYRVGERYYATQDTCTHALASLAEGWLEGHEVYCPVHEARFDIRDGRPLCFPATEPLRSFPVEVVDGRVCADLSGARRSD